MGWWSGRTQAQAPEASTSTQDGEEDFAAGFSGGGSACPVPARYRQQQGVFNVYNQRIDTGALASSAGSGAIDPNNQASSTCVMHPAFRS